MPLPVSETVTVTYRPAVSSYASGEASTTVAAVAINEKGPTLVRGRAQNEPTMH